MTVLFATDSDLQVLVRRSTTLNRHFDELADTINVEHLERIVLQDSRFVVHRQELVLRVLAREGEDRLREIVQYAVAEVVGTRIVRAWNNELVERTRSVPLSESIAKVTGRKLDFMIIDVLAIAVVVLAVERFASVEETPSSSLSNDDRRSIAALAHAYGISGRQKEAETLLRELLSSEQYVPSDEIAVIFAGLDRQDEALTWLERAYEEKDSTWLVDVALDPRFQQLHSTSRFQSLTRRIGLP